MIEAVERHAIYVDKEAFNQEQSRYREKRDLEREIRKEVKKLTKKTPAKEFHKDVMNNFYSHLEKSYEDVNPMKLKGQKLVMLLDIDISNLQALSEKYDSVKSAKEPSLTAHTIYAETDEEMSKLDTCNKLINFITHFKESTGLHKYPKDVEAVFKGIIIYDMRKNHFYPNSRWIKNLRY
tara:strand:- start:34 stop:573 length:540 start_codon:yes stop_codon:yes gene_type:complete